MDNETDVLLVEDNPTDAELTLRALRRNNLADRLAWVKDGAEALDFLFRRGDYSARPDTMPRVMLLDVHMPKLNGLEVLEQMRADERTRDIPVVVLTSSKEERDIVDSYKLGANSYVSKPVSFDEFVKTVTDLGLYWLVVNRVPAHLVRAQ